MTEPCGKSNEIDKMLKVIYGNGEPGMKTDIALIKDHLKRMPSASQLKAYAFLGAGAFLAVGLLGKYFIAILDKV